MLIVNGNLALKIVAVQRRHEWGRVTWKLPLAATPRADFILCAQLDHANAEVAGFYLLPVADFTEPYVILKAEALVELSRYRHDTLTSIFGVGTQ